MELLLNTFWLVIAAGALGVWIRRWRRGAKRQDLPLPLFALGCVLVLLLPVISVTDDLHATTLAVEASGLSRKILKSITPSGASARTRLRVLPLVPLLALFSAPIRSLVGTAPERVWQAWLYSAQECRHTLCGAFRTPVVVLYTSLPTLTRQNARSLLLKILVCMKQVPQKDAPLKLNETGAWIREDVSYEVNEPDAYALEEALRQKEKHSGEVVVITAGPAHAQQVLREALAKGADRAIHLEDASFVRLDAINTARAFAAAIKGEKFDLIFTGLQSDDYGYAQTGVVLAELLGWPHATIIMQIEKSDSGIRVKRELEAGYFQFVEMPLPALLTIQSGINKLRYATLIGIKQAKNKPLRKVTFPELQSAIGSNMQKIERLYVPQKTKNTEFLEGPPGEVAKKLAENMSNEVRII